MYSYLQNVIYQFFIYFVDFHCFCDTKMHFTIQQFVFHTGQMIYYCRAKSPIQDSIVKQVRSVLVSCPTNDVRVGCACDTVHEVCHTAHSTRNTLYDGCMSTFTTHEPINHITFRAQKKNQHSTNTAVKFCFANARELFISTNFISNNSYLPTQRCSSMNSS